MRSLACLRRTLIAMGTVEDVLRIARAEIGTTESPAGSNKVKYNRDEGFADGNPWCAAFVCWVFTHAHVPLPSHTAYTPSLANAFKQAGGWIDGTSIPHVGDLVFFDFVGGHNRIEHVGIVTGYSGSSIQTIEGNTSAGSNTNGGQVQARTRKRDRQIVGYGQPIYTLEDDVTSDELTAIVDQRLTAFCEVDRPELGGKSIIDVLALVAKDG